MSERKTGGGRQLPLRGNLLVSEGLILPDSNRSGGHDDDLFLENVFEKTNKGKRVRRKERKNKRGDRVPKDLLAFSRGGFLNWKMKGEGFRGEESYQLLLFFLRRLKCLSILSIIYVLLSE